MKTPKRGRPLKEDQRDAERDLLDAAIRHFAKHGFRKGALADIASDAGVSIGLIRHYFGSKDGLIADCTRIVSEELGEIFGTMLDGELPVDGPDFINELQRRAIAEMSDKVHLLFYLKHLSIEQPAASSAVFRNYFQMLQGELNRLEAIGRLRKDVNKVWLTFQLMFMQMGPVYLSEQIEAIVGIPAHSPRAINERVEENGRILTHGVLAADRQQ
jgi:AcrR family transcriptional regulator